MSPFPACIHHYFSLFTVPLVSLPLTQLQREKLFNIQYQYYIGRETLADLTFTITAPNPLPFISVCI